MSDNYVLFFPDLVVLISVRTILSLIGILCIVFGGIFGFEKRWDEEGSAEVLLNKKGGGDNTTTPTASNDDDAKDKEQVETQQPMGTATTKTTSDTTTATAVDPSCALDNTHDKYIDIFCLVDDNPNDTVAKMKSKQLNTKYNSWSIQHLKQHPSRVIALFGWFLLTFSMLFLDSRYYGFHFTNMKYHNHYQKGHIIMTIIMFLLLISMALIQHILVPYYMIHRRVYEQNTIILGSIVGPPIFMLFGFILSLSINQAPPLWFAPLGGFFVGLAHYLYWFNRKMGHQYEITGLPGTGIVYHFGGIFLGLGWFLLWIGINGVHALPNSNLWFLPIYFSQRLVIATLGVTCIILVTWFTSYAQDEATDPKNDDDDTNNKTNNINKNTTQLTNKSGMDDQLLPTNPDTYMYGAGFGYGQWFCANVYEVKYVMILAWFILSLCPFTYLYTMDNIAEPILLFILINILGIATACQNEYGLRACNVRVLVLLNKVMIVTYVLISGIVYYTSGLKAASCSTIGSILILSGMAILYRDRKRGQYWLSKVVAHREMNNNNNITTGDIEQVKTMNDNDNNLNAAVGDDVIMINPKYTVYSTGPVLYTTGLLFFAWGLSMP